MSPSDDVPDLSGLAALARDPRLDLKPVILRVQTDLFAAAPARDLAALREFESLALGLIPTVDAATAGIVARKLAPVPDAPEAVLAVLAGLGGDARIAVVSLVPTLTPTVLEAALAAGGDLGPLVALRRDLAQSAVRDLISRDDPRIDLALALNDGLSLASGDLDLLVARARQRPTLAGVLLARADLVDLDLAPLYLFADPGRRAAIRGSFAAFAALWPPTRRGGDGEAGAVLTGLSAHRDGGGFRAALAAALGLAAPELLDYGTPGSRDVLALALRAAGLSSEDAIYCFLTLDPEIARSVDTVNGLARLFRETDPATARLLLAALLDAPEIAGGERPARHQPHLDPSGTPSRGACHARKKPAARAKPRVRRAGHTDGR